MATGVPDETVTLAQIVAALGDLADRLAAGESWEPMHLVDTRAPIGWRSTVNPEPRHRWWNRTRRAHRAGWLAGMNHAAEQILMAVVDPAEFTVERRP